MLIYKALEKQQSVGITTMLHMYITDVKCSTL